MMCGGFGNAKEADADIVAYANEVKASVETALGRTFTTYEPTHYKSQVVAGINYSIKIKTDTDYIHVKVHKPLPCNGTELVVMETSQGHSLETAL